ncbi:MAG: CopG family ribbon-helix-helix protein [Xenococcaceae cyanobacterium]
MNRRINITLPDETLESLDRVVAKGDRSSFINKAVKFYIAEIQKKRLAEQLKEGAIRRAERDLNLAESWFSLEEEAWLENQK